MVKAFLIKYSEIGIKGKNRYIFEDALRDRVIEKLARCEGEFLVEKENGRIYVEAKSEFDFDEVIENLTKCFGIAHICPVVLVEDKTFETVCKELLEHRKEEIGDKPFTFKVFAKSGSFCQRRDPTPRVCVCEQY